MGLNQYKNFVSETSLSAEQVGGEEVQRMAVGVLCPK